MLVELDDALAERLAARARRLGVAPEVLARDAVERLLVEEQPDRAPEDTDAAFAWIGAGESDVQAVDVDRHLAGGFGR